MRHAGELTDQVRWSVLINPKDLRVLVLRFLNFSQDLSVRFIYLICFRNHFEKFVQLSKFVGKIRQNSCHTVEVLLNVPLNTARNQIRRDQHPNLPEVLFVVLCVT